MPFWDVAIAWARFCLICIDVRKVPFIFRATHFFSVFCFLSVASPQVHFFSSRARFLMPFQILLEVFVENLWFALF